MEETHKNAIIINETASDIRVRESGNWNAMIIKSKHRINIEIINLLVLWLLLLVEDSEFPEAVVHVYNTVLVAFRVLFDLLHLDVLPMKVLHKLDLGSVQAVLLDHIMSVVVLRHGDRTARVIRDYDRNQVELGGHTVTIRQIFEDTGVIFEVFITFVHGIFFIDNHRGVVSDPCQGHTSHKRQMLGLSLLKAKNSSGLSVRGVFFFVLRGRLVVIVVKILSPNLWSVVSVNLFFFLSEGFVLLIVHEAFFWFFFALGIEWILKGPIHLVVTALAPIHWRLWTCTKVRILIYRLILDQAKTTSVCLVEILRDLVVS